MQSPEGNKCSFVSASFSTDLSYFAISCSGPDPAVVKIYRNGLAEAPYEWQMNTGLRDRLREYELPRVEIFHVPVDGGFDAAVKMLLPPEIDFDNFEQVKDKYPLLVRVYGGPGSVRISSSYSVGHQVRNFDFFLL
jgi:dipeptidyl aminopeptidase/acylaminoacyl peptidase